jgi:hypothetical protein
MNNVIKKVGWSATQNGKIQCKYPEYPWEVKEQIEKMKTKRKMADELTSLR